jgi:hypothetical protein
MRKNSELRIKVLAAARKQARRRIVIKRGPDGTLTVESESSDSQPPHIRGRS